MSEFDIERRRNEQEQKFITIANKCGESIEETKTQLLSVFEIQDFQCEDEDWLDTLAKNIHYKITVENDTSCLVLLNKLTKRLKQNPTLRLEHNEVNQAIDLGRKIRKGMNLSSMTIDNAKFCDFSEANLEGSSFRGEVFGCVFTEVARVAFNGGMHECSIDRMASCTIGGSGLSNCHIHHMNNTKVGGRDLRDNRFGESVLNYDQYNNFQTNERDHIINNHVGDKLLKDGEEIYTKVRMI